MAGKTELELYLKKAVDKVMKEKMRIQKREALAKKRKQSAKYFITALDHIDSKPNLASEADQSDCLLSQEERERVIEIMLGQEKVIALLYDKSG